MVEIAFVNTASQSHLPRDKVLLVNYTPRYFRNMQTDENQPSFPHHRLGLPDMIIHANVLIFIFLVFTDQYLKFQTRTLTN